MKLTTKIKLKIEVELDLECEFNPAFREVDIISANIPESQVSARKVYACMASGNYNDLDSRVQKEIKAKFIEDTRDLHSVQASKLPDVEVRSIPCEHGDWLRIMKNFRNSGLPLALVGQVVTSLGVMIEPVLYRTPTAYLWPRDISAILDLESISKHMKSTKAVNIEKQTDGSVKVTWNRIG